MPSTVSSSVDIVLDSSTVITPSLPTFFIASAMMLPMVLSLLAELVPTWAIMSPLTGLESFLTSSVATSTAFSMPRLRAIGLAPAATAFTPSRKIDCARMVAVVVPSPATSDVLDATSRTICTHILERILQLDLFRDGHAVLGDIRPAELLFQNHVPAAGAQRNLHRVRQLVHAAKNGLPGIFCINDLFCHVRFSP